jgi:4a-hydroxytetrahydrobiopterin dehydratase
MMTDLASQECEACRADAPRATREEIERWTTEIPEWSIIEIEGVSRLERTFRFDDFRAALAFTNRVGDAAEEAGHHPALLTEWGRVRVQWWTHKIRGLHRNDFILAARTDRLE